MKISVVIPCYNGEGFVNKAIESVLQQEGVAYEIILVDNNSTDNTLGVLQGFASRYPDKISVLTELRKGAPAARNKGLHAATGDWIQFLDADDELLPGKFARQAGISSSNQPDIICGAYQNVQVFSGKAKLVRKLYHIGRIMSGGIKGKIEGYTLKATRSPHKGAPWKALIGGKLGITSANLWRREKVLEVQGWDENLTSSQEYDMLFRLLASGAKIAVDDQPAAIRYKLDSSISSGTSSQSVLRITDNYVNLRKRIVAFLKQQGKFTPELKAYTDHILYTYLMRSKDYDPAAFDERLKEANAQVPASVKISSNVMYMFRKLFRR